MRQLNKKLKESLRFMEGIMEGINGKYRLISRNPIGDGATSSVYEVEEVSTNKKLTIFNDFYFNRNMYLIF